MSIIYDNKTHMYIGEVNPEDGTVTSFTSSMAYATRFEEKDEKTVAKIKELRDVEVIELD